MKKLLALAVFATAAHVAPAAWAAQPLLTPAELKAHTTQATPPRVIDIRDPASYGAQHIPGAVNAPYGKWRGPASNPGELPDLPRLTALVQSLGLTPTTHAVVVSTGADPTDFGAAARVYWTLKLLGLKELSILNGGMKAWGQAGLTSFSAHNATRPPHGGLVAWRGDQYQGVSADGLATSNPASCQACSPPSSGRTLEKPARCSWRASRAADISAGQSQ